MVEEKDWVLIKITPQIKSKAEDMAKERGIETQKYSHVSKDAEYIGAVCELAVGAWLRENNRKCENIDNRGKSDGGVDLVIKAGTVNVKGSNFPPKLDFRLFVREDLSHNADLFAQCFIQGSDCWLVGIETHREIIQEKYREFFNSKKYDFKVFAYIKYVKDLSIKPLQLLTNEFTQGGKSR